MQLALMFIGAMLAILGMFAGAVADRIRGNKRTVRECASTRSGRKTSPTVDSAREAVTTTAHKALRRDVIAALTQSGFTKPEAAEAVDGCKGAEQSTLESWTRSALKRMSA